MANCDQPHKRTSVAQNYFPEEDQILPPVNAAKTEICLFVHLLKETKLRIHNIRAKVLLKLGSEAWVLKKREEKRLKAAQMEFLRNLLGITKLDKEKNQCIRENTEAQNVVQEIK